MFTPVIKKFSLNPSIPVLSTKIGKTTSLIWSYSTIASTLCDVINQYIFSVVASFTVPIHLASAGI